MYWGGFLWPCMEGERNGEDTFNSHITAFSGTYDNEERTTSLQRTNCLPPAYILFLHFYIYTSEKGTTSEQRTKHSPSMCPLFGGCSLLQCRDTHWLGS